MRKIPRRSASRRRGRRVFIQLPIAAANSGLPRRVIELPGKKGKSGETVVSLITRLPVLDPLLEEPGAVDPVRWHPRRAGFQPGAKLLVHAQQLAGLDAVRKQLSNDGNIQSGRGREERRAGHGCRR